MLKMNLIPFAVLAFCIHQVIGQESITPNQYAKSPRHLTDRGPIKFSTNYVSREKLTVDDTPDEFVITKPAKKDKTYDDFLSFLYRNDKTKSKVKRAIDSTSLINEQMTRGKRMIVFRPLFVYKQQQIKREKVIADKKRKTTTKPRRSQG